MPDFEGSDGNEILDLLLDLQAKQDQWGNEIRKAMSNGSIVWDEFVVMRALSTINLLLPRLRS
ncbi:hypothetical protein [Nitrosomonas supralitoralis]|uniref:Uncharacterized protein n=1 Tax=Nitrosomonas supralitoralis TaxID=2116706 RepID=A0A2P7NS52_9PROT|nr:hypothetical protein [Nitrosomonas supralitoralis]PSJ16275.1 hypothetical protein C7H79_14280 [Nitrosomonas supralitoralis]